MKRSIALFLLAASAVVSLPAPAAAEPIQFKLHGNYSRATFKTDAPLETIVDTTAGPAVTGNLTVDESGKEVPAEVKGILTIKQKPVETVADARVTYIKLTPEQVEAQKRFGFASENIKVRSKLGTTFSNHGMTIPQLMFLKLSNEIAIETDLTFAKQ